MMRNKKMSWPKLSLQVISYKIENMKQVITETEIFGVYHLGDMPFYRHDPEGTIKIFCQQHNIGWQYTHETWLHKQEYKPAKTLQ